MNLFLKHLNLKMRNSGLGILTICIFVLVIGMHEGGAHSPGCNFRNSFSSLGWPRLKFILFVLESAVVFTVLSSLARLNVSVDENSNRRARPATLILMIVTPKCQKM